MLVLSRKTGETLKIGENITVTVVQVRGNRVKIGIKAPQECSVRRGELQKQPPLEGDPHQTSAEIWLDLDGNDPDADVTLPLTVGSR